MNKRSTQSSRAWSWGQHLFSQQPTIPVPSIAAPSAPAPQPKPPLSPPIQKPEPVILPEKPISLRAKNHARLNQMAQANASANGNTQNIALPTHANALPPPPPPSQASPITEKIDISSPPDLPPADISKHPNQQTQPSFVPRLIAVLLVTTLGVALYLLWHNTTPDKTTTLNTTSVIQPTPQISINETSNLMKIYITGAVSHPGIYNLALDARVYDLLQAAGGPLPEADLVTLNLAAHLLDGQEVYVTKVGEVPPTYIGGVAAPISLTSSNNLININLASAEELHNSLKITTTQAQTIVNYRQQHGFYTNIDQLTSILGQTTYDKMKYLITI